MHSLHGGGLGLLLILGAFVWIIVLAAVANGGKADY